MADEWTGRIVGRLHTHRIKRAELAAEMGISAQYVSMVLNGKKYTNGIQERMEAAIQAIVDRQNVTQSK